jgi:hypothetical protein
MANWPHVTSETNAVADVQSADSAAACLVAAAMSLELDLNVRQSITRSQEIWRVGVRDFTYLPPPLLQSPMRSHSMTSS